uniref:G_PROTEIN_RECEP_F1_2 domain-containing protein n=1 Tax=Ascaris lumbricoides TaxID=6252 RepID=A0A0M3IIN1_ASCLU
MISFVWFVSFLSNSGSLAIFDAVPYKTAWNCRSMASPLVDFFYQVYVTLILLLIPLTIMTVLYGNVIFTLKTGIRFDMNLTVSVNSLECPNNIFGTRFGGQLSGNGSASAGWLLDAMLFPTWATKPFSDMNTSGLSSLKVPGFPLSRSHTASFSMSPNGSSFHSKRLMSVFSTSSVSFLYNTRRRSGDVDNSYLLRSTHQVIFSLCHCQPYRHKYHFLLEGVIISVWFLSVKI